MNIFFFSNRRKVVSVLILGFIAVSSFLYTQFVLDSILQQERSSVELWAKAIEYTNRDLNPDTIALLDNLALELANIESASPQQLRRWNRTLDIAKSELSNAGLDFIANELIINNRFNIPSVATDQEGNIILYKDIDEESVDNETVSLFAALNTPIEIPVLMADGSYAMNYVYYGRSGVSQSLLFFPYVQFGLLALFLGLIYINISNIRRTEQSNLWVGMAKEAAHQLGTPLSSMFGWIELLRSTTSEPETINVLHELEEDVKRLQNVAERFNKIGSGPEYSSIRIEPILANVIDYIERRLPRFSKNVEIRRNIDSDLKCEINSELFSWAIENIMKNALDAIDSNHTNAFVEIRTFVENNNMIIEIEDSGKGIDKKYFEEIFMPGFSTKKRGWGLGLSLTKRIIEDYHKGKVFIHKSTVGKGTTFRIIIPVDSNA
jgi:signal transduction histidine kinase